MTDPAKYGKHVDQSQQPRHHDDRGLPQPGDRGRLHRPRRSPRIRELPTIDPPELPNQSSSTRSSPPRRNPPADRSGATSPVRRNVQFPWTHTTSPTCTTCLRSIGPPSQRGSTGLPAGAGLGRPDRHTCWLATINPDGSPHVTGIGALWYDGAFWFETGERPRKGRNLARDPRCTLSLATHDFDLVVEGEAQQVTDPTTVADMAARGPTAAGRPGSTTRHGGDRRVQRPVRRAAAMARLPPGAPVGHGPRHRRPGAATRWDF